MFIHCPGWTLNEVKLLLGRASWKKIALVFFYMLYSIIFTLV